MSSGHEHSHEHGHEHHHAAHGHDHHDHAHHEKTVETSWGKAQLEAYTHEQAATVSMILLVDENVKLAFADVVSLMRRIAEGAEAVGGIIGHVKGIARQGDSFAHASVTATYLEPAIDGDMALECVAGTDVQLVAIVLLVDLDDLVRICEEALKGKALRPNA